MSFLYRLRGWNLFTLRRTETLGVSKRNPTSCSKGGSEETHQLAEERRRAYIRGLVIPGENHRLWTLDVAPEHVPFLDRRRRDGWRSQLRQVAVRHADGQVDGALTSILRLRSLKMEEMMVSSSVCWTSSLDGQMSRRYTSFPSDVTPTTHTHTQQTRHESNLYK